MRYKEVRAGICPSSEKGSMTKHQPSPESTWRRQWTQWRAQLWADSPRKQKGCQWVNFRDSMEGFIGKVWKKGTGSYGDNICCFLIFILYDIYFLGKYVSKCVCTCLHIGVNVLIHYFNYNYFLSIHDAATTILDIRVYSREQDKVPGLMNLI